MNEPILDENLNLKNQGQHTSIEDALNACVAHDAGEGKTKAPI